MAETAKDRKQPIQDLEAIKRLLVLALLKAGAKQSEIAEALGTSQASVSRMFSKGAVTRGWGKGPKEGSD